MLDVLRELLRIQDNNRANEPRRNKLTVTKLEEFKKKLEKRVDGKKKNARMLADVKRVIKELKKEGGEDMVLWLAERLEDRVRPGVDLVCKLKGEGWPVEVGKTMHIQFDTAAAMHAAVETDGALLKRVTSIIRNQRGIVDFQPNPTRMSVEVMHVDFVDGDEEDESIRVAQSTDRSKHFAANHFMQEHQREAEQEAEREFAEFMKERDKTRGGGDERAYNNDEENAEYERLVRSGDPTVQTSNASFGSGPYHVHRASVEASSQSLPGDDISPMKLEPTMMVGGVPMIVDDDLLTVSEGVALDGYLDANEPPPSSSPLLLLWHLQSGTTPPQPIRNGNPMVNEFREELLEAYFNALATVFGDK